MSADIIILASLSPFRAELLKNAAINFTTQGAQINEREIEDSLSDINPYDLSKVLAEAKALDVSSRNFGALVIGCDQTLSLNGKVLHKAKTMDEAHRRLAKLSGQTHYLNSAICLAKDGQIIWSEVVVAAMTMRVLAPDFIGRHLVRVGQKILNSVGAYQIEGEGIQLFEKIEGDHFTIIGLPLLQLLQKLRLLGVIDG